MLPTQSKYPEYVADQLLTADNLNDAFDYLEEGERLTRVNLIGIGIVCGMEVRTGSDESGAFITITAGCGITSEGYLVEVPEQTYRRYKDYKPLTEITYDRFVTASPAAERFHLDELVMASSGEGITDINVDFLDDKLVILYVELLLKKAKNCDPESCDDKGSGITVTFRPLVVNLNAAGVDSLRDTGGVQSNLSNGLMQLKPLALPRIDVPSTDMVSTADVLQAFNAIVISSFVEDLASALGDLGTLLGGMLTPPAGDPASILRQQWSILRGSYSPQLIMQLPYYYDLLSDLLEAYNELRLTAEELIAECCPDSGRFARHLLLGTTGGDDSLQNRTSFTPSPATDEGSIWLKRLRSLWARLSAMITSFAPPQVANADGNSQLLTSLRITPSRYGRATLSERAIPFYYSLRNETVQLLSVWNEQLSRRNRTDTILGYETAGLPNALPQVSNPLMYDLEPYNFLRIEGATGMNYSLALREIEQQIAQYRLPVEVVTLRTGVGDGPEVFGPAMDCYFEDLQLGYELVRREVEAVIGKTTEYLHSFEALPSDIIDGAFGEPRYQPFNQKLITIKTYFVQDLRDFIGSYNEFLALYTDIENEAQAIRDRLFRSFGVHNPNREITHVSDDNDDFIEDLIDHLDNIVMCCEKGGFRTVYEQYARKSEAIYSRLFLGDFLEKHPGIQHKAGVTMGGTFILVCTPPVNNLQNRFLAGNNVAPAQPVATQDSPQPAPAAASVAGGLPVINKPDVIGRKIITDEIETDFWKKRFEHIDGDNPLTELAQQIPGGTVIADFFLPYRISECCGDSVTFLVNDAEPPEKLSIVVEQKEFCAGTDKTITVQGLPEGGELKGQGIVKSEDGKSYVFNPSSVRLQQNERMRDVLLTYSKGNSRPVHETLRVYARPVMDFGVVSINANTAGQIIPITDDQEFSGTITFGSLSQNAGHLEWTFDDGSPAQRGAQITVQFGDSPGKKTITLTGRNGICTGSVSKTLSVVIPGIFLPATDYCFDTAERPTFILHPKGGIVYNDSTYELHVVKEGDDYKFVPAAVGLNGQISRQVTIYYNTPGGQQFSISPTVYMPVSGSLSLTPNDDGVTWAFTAENTYGQTYEWDFGDGTTDNTSGAQVSHTYAAKDAGYTVQVIIRNGPCSVTLNDKVQVHKNSCFPLMDIISDYNKFKNTDAGQNINNDKPAIDNYFLSLAVAGNNTSAQLESMTDKRADEQLRKWIADLNAGISAPSTKGYSGQIQLVSILARNVFYIACFQDSDLDKESLKAGPALQELADGIKSWSKTRKSFSRIDVAAKDDFLKVVLKEQDLTKSKGDDGNKKQYWNALTAIINALNDLK